MLFQLVLTKIILIDYKHFKALKCFSTYLLVNM